MMFEVMKYRDRWQIALIHFGGRLFPITRQNVNKQLQKYCLIACIPSISAHKFRHGCAIGDRIPACTFQHAGHGVGVCTDEYGH